VKSADKATEVGFEGFSYCGSNIALAVNWQVVSNMSILEYNTFGESTYNSAASTFTAPKTGYYEFVLHGYSPTGGSGYERYAMAVSLG